MSLNELIEKWNELRRTEVATVSVHLRAVGRQEDQRRPSPALVPFTDVGLKVCVHLNRDEVFAQPADHAGVGIGTLVHPTAGKTSLDSDIYENQPVIAARLVECERSPPPRQSILDAVAATWVPVPCAPPHAASNTHSQSIRRVILPTKNV